MARCLTWPNWRFEVFAESEPVMIELAPQSKTGLALANPVMIAGGCGGYGSSYQPLLDLAAFGALVTNPITLRPRGGPAQPRLVETRAGFILNNGGQNPGVKKVLRQYAPAWSRLGLPVIAGLPADEPEYLRRTARALAESGVGVAAIELDIPLAATASDIERWVMAVRTDCLLPLLARLPLEAADLLAEATLAAGADALVIGAPPFGAAAAPPAGQVVGGYLYGPALHSLALAQLQLVRDMADAPLIAAGGIHSLNDALAFLDAGATAVQIDSLLFIDPLAAYEIAVALRPA